MLTFYAAVAIAGITVACIIPLSCKMLKSKGVMDNPNARSSHKIPTPRGGGIAIIIAIIGGTLVLYVGAITLPTFWITILFIACGLACVSWLDDLKGLSALTRLISQVIAVSVAIYMDPSLSEYTIWILPHYLTIPIFAVSWIWFINLYNFMDGIDGITGVETISICIGLGAMASIGHLPQSFFAPLMIISTSALVFLYWNWSPAKIFLGDVGSIPLGFMLGWFLLHTVTEGAWVIAIIIPGFYLCDATLTLLKRAWQRKPIWQAHREHFYQMPALKDIAHNRIMLPIISANLGLIIIALWLVPVNLIIAITAAILIILGLLWKLKRMSL